MTAAGANGSTVNQSGKAAAANGKGRLRGDGAGAVMT